jgi:hypothetical protein
MAHEYKIVDPNVAQSDEDRKQDLYIQIESLEMHHKKLNDVENKTSDQNAELAGIESHLSDLISEYETLGGTFG